MQQKIKIVMDGQFVKQVDGIIRHPDYQRLSSQQKLAHYASQVCPSASVKRSFVDHAFYLVSPCNAEQFTALCALTGGSGHQPNDSTAMIGNIGKYKHCDN